MRCVRLLMALAALLGMGILAQAAEPLPAPMGPVVLTVSGKIDLTNHEGQAQFDKEMLESLGRASFMTGSEVSDKPQLFEGVPLRAVLERIGARGSKMMASALNDYEVSIPMEDLQFEPILAMKVDGQVLTIRDKGPLWIVYPRDDHRVLYDVKYYARSVWQLNRLTIE